MSTPSLSALLRSLFPDAVFDENDPSLRLGSFPQWDSLGHFNFLMSIEEAYDVRFSMEEMAELKSLDDIQAAIATRDVA